MGKSKVKAKAKLKAKAKTKTVKVTKKAKPAQSAKKAKPVKAKAKVKAKTAKTAPAKKAAPVKFGKVTSAPVKSIDYTKVVTPLGDRLVVRVVAAARMTAGGLYIPETVSDVQGHLKGEVLAAGSGARNKKGNKRPLDVKVGDKIFFDDHSATKITFGKEDLHIVKEIDVLGVAK